MKLELRGITKSFGALIANDGVDFTVQGGEIHVLLGENGAGKSTLMNVLYGLYRPDSGEILVDGRPVHFANPGDASRAGIGMVHQHFMLIPTFTVAESVILGNENVDRFGRLDVNGARDLVRRLCNDFHFDLDPDRLVADLTVGAKQQLEIIKLLARDAEILVFDEPTAVLTPIETDQLMKIMQRLAKAGKGIIFITHKLREVRDVADAITIMRAGRVVGEAERTASNNELAALMVGRPVQLVVEKSAADPGAVALKIVGLNVVSAEGHPLVRDIDLEVKCGEIVAIAGVQGNGQPELVEAILGLREPESGRITLHGADLGGRTVRHVLGAGVGFVPEDRNRDGVVAEFSVAENLMLDRSRSKPFVRSGFLQSEAIRRFAEEKKIEFDIRAEGVDTLLGQLSGGNQQKVVLARELSRDLRLLVISQPTRGIDVGSIEFVHRHLVEARSAGLPVLLVSSELDEIQALADRIAVMYDGRIVGTVDGSTSRTALGLMMIGEIADAESTPAEGDEASSW